MPYHVLEATRRGREYRFTIDTPTGPRVWAYTKDPDDARSIAQFVAACRADIRASLNAEFGGSVTTIEGVAGTDV